MIRKRRRHRSYSHEDQDHHSWITYVSVLALLLLCFISFTIIAIMYQNHTVIEASNHEPGRDTTRKPIEEQSQIKSKISKELIDAFRKSNLPVNLDKKTGDITFDGDILFEKGSSTLSHTGKKNLADFFPTYVGVLLSHPFKDQVSAIVIEGHTDPTGDYLHNLDLSQARASSVVRMIYSKKFPDFPQKIELQKLISANGRSYSDPVLVKGAQTIDAAKSRRVVFKFLLKDDDTIKDLTELMGKTP